MLKEKDTEIQILKKKLKILERHHIQTPKLISVQTERDEFNRDMLKYKEQVTQYQNRIKQYEEMIALMEK